MNVHHSLIAQLATELSATPAQIQATVKLLDEGATVPFIARYRKEITGGLDDGVLRLLEVRLLYLRELFARRDSIIEALQAKGQLNDELLQQLQTADTKQRLEDLYAPYKPKRRTRAQMAREAGLAPLADALLHNVQNDPNTLAASFVNPEANIPDAKAALDGARDIVAEQFAEDADLLSRLRMFLQQQGVVYAKVVEGKEEEGSNFRDWFDFSEPLRTLPSHRALALLRGRNKGILDLRLGLSPEQEALHPHPCLSLMAKQLGVGADFNPNATPQARWLAEALRWAWRVKLTHSLETELMTQLREQAEEQAIAVFAANLKDLLLAAPAGAKTVLGLDPGIRTGVKVAAIDATGKLLETTTIYPFEPRRDVQGSVHRLLSLIAKHQIQLIAIGNGTASRETEKLIAQVLSHIPDTGVKKIVVSEAGASVYSASALAAQEFPDIDVSLRSAISIARRLQDPLAELVKIEPKAIGVGQYQHDVNQSALGRSLNAVVEDCVNAVGVDVNTASVALLSQVSGLNNNLANHIVQHRNAHGPFQNRQQLLNVNRFGPKAFEQSAGFLRIHGGNNPLDASAVHPEAYAVVERIVRKTGQPMQSLIGQTLKGISPSDFIDERFGLPTVKDILKELEKPGRDPRPEFTSATFEEGIESIADLRIGMQLEGVVTNVANFGAFVDIGVHQDGLVHISALADQYVRDPRDVVRVGQTVKVRVTEVDVARQRIGLSMRSDTRPHSKTPKVKTPTGTMAAALSKLKRH